MCYFRKYHDTDINETQYNNAIESAKKSLIASGEATPEKADQLAEREVEELVHVHNAHLAEEAAKALKKLEDILAAMKHNAGYVADDYAIETIECAEHNLNESDQHVKALNTYFEDYAE